MKKRTSQPICFVISSPSGAGKTTLVEKVLTKDKKLQKTVSHTTRPMRPGEKKSVHYHFVTGKKFQEMKQGKRFLEWAKVYDNHYGTAKSEIDRILKKGKDAILVIENKGAKAIARLFPDSVFVLILPPSLKELQKRVTSRKHAGDDVKQRLRNAKKEIKGLLWYDYVIINENLSESIELLQNIIATERSRLSRHQKLIQAKF
jgi:guanylate kinase